MEQRKSWAVKDEALVEELLGLIKLSDQEKSALSSVKQQAASIAHEMAKTFHAKLLATENTKQYFENVAVEHITSRLAEWFTDLFSANYDENYAKKRITIGNVHVKIGLPVRYPIVMMEHVLSYGEKVAKLVANADEVFQAFKKVLAMDIAIFSQAYEDAQLRHLAEVVGGEMLARRLLSEK
jgi:hypothetical protein